MCVIEVSIPDELLDDASMDRTDAAKFVKRAVAVEFYRKGSASIGYCADFAEMTIEDFIRSLEERHISIFHFDSPESFDREYARCPK